NIAGLDFCIDIEYVSSIITPQNKKMLTIKNKLGNENIKVYEEMLPILNFHSVFGLKTPPEDDNTRYVLLDFRKRKIPFMVDNIKEIISLNKKTRDALKYVPIEDKPYLVGKIIYEGQIILYPDLEKIIRDQKSYRINSVGSRIDSKNEE
ncbi:MAG: CheW domain-containing protein, partial [Ignavibacteria bacterium]|nr:CheW domain-containing protein [Ignavibacteria bacterium]